MRRGLFLAIGFGMTLLLLTAGAGCGKKGDPRPPRAAPLAVVEGLSAARHGEGVVLAWSLSGPADAVGSFRIVRSRPEPAGRACPGCPREYLPLATLKPGDLRLERTGERGFRFVDSDAAAGRSFFYRVSVCDRRGSCGDGSEEAGVLPAAGRTP